MIIQSCKSVPFADLVDIGPTTVLEEDSFIFLLDLVLEECMETQVFQKRSRASDCDPSEDPAIMRDIHDSPSWKQAFSEGGFCNGHLQAMMLQLSTDGVNPFSGNKVNYSMWPIMLTMLNLPRNVCSLFENIMLVGVVPAQTDSQEPKHLDPYLEIVVDEILELSGSTFCDASRNDSFTFRVALMNYVLDYPGLGKVFTAAGQTALQGCMWCELRGKATDKF